MAAGKEELAGAADKLGAIMEQSKSMGGGLAQAMFTKVADKFYDLVVRSDVGIIDVSWGLKDQKTQAVTRLTNQKSLELKAVEEDFRKVTSKLKSGDDVVFLIRSGRGSGAGSIFLSGTLP